MYTPTYTPSYRTTIWDETKQIPEDYYQHYSAVFDSGTKLYIDVTTDGSAVDVMVMDSANFNDYTRAMASSDGGTWNNYISEKYIVQKSFTFTTPSTDRYYIVIDNTDSPEGGAYTYGAVNVRFKVTY